MDAKVKKIFVQKYLKEEVLKTRGAWPREMKIFNTLSASYPDESFWHWYSPTFKLNSLAWFIGDGKGDLFRAHESFTFDKLVKTPIVNSSTPTEVIPPNPIIEKPKTLSSWLKK